MDFDRTNSSVIAGPSSSRNVFDRVDSRYEPGRNQRSDKGKGKAAETDDRVSSIQRRLNPETGKMARSYMNRQGKPVFIKRPCSICERNGRPDNMHFTFECIDYAPRAHISETMDDQLAGQLTRTSSGHLTSYNFQHANTHTGVIYHEDDDEDEATTDSESGNGLGGW
jgi:hypothetical protein